MGSPEDPSNFINAVIDEKAFDRIASYIDYVKEQDDAEIIAGEIMINQKDILLNLQ